MTDIRSGSRQRIDAWLYFARLVKSRALAAELTRSGRVRVNGVKIRLPGRRVGIGDVLTLGLAHRVAIVRILAPAARRGPFEEARRLYEGAACQ